MIELLLTDSKSSIKLVLEAFLKNSEILIPNPLFPPFEDIERIKEKILASGSFLVLVKLVFEVECKGFIVVGIIEINLFNNCVNWHDV